MSSPHWDETRAAAYREFRFEFPERTLSGRTVVVAGGTGGLGAATVAMLAREGANLVVGYRENRERAGGLRTAIEGEFGRELILVEGDLCQAGTRRKYLEAAESLDAPVAGCGGPDRSGGRVVGALTVSSLSSWARKVLGARKNPRQRKLLYEGCASVLVAIPGLGLARHQRADQLLRAIPGSA